jgi:hypothetical protein
VLTYALGLLLRSAVLPERTLADREPYNHVLRDIANGKNPAEHKSNFTPPATPDEAIASYERLRS